MSTLFLALAALGTLGVALAFIAGLVVAGRGSLLAWRQARATRPRALRVLARRDHGPYFQLDLAEGGLARLPWPHATARGGQYLSLRPHIAGRTVTRRYSLAALPRWHWRHGRIWQLAIKREAGGLVSNWLADHLVPGQRIETLPAAGHFVWPARPQGEQVLVAGGIGITPMRAMLQAWLRQGSPVPLTLLWSVREAGEWMDYRSEFETLATQHAMLRFVPLLTGADPDWNGERGRLDGARLLALAQSARPGGIWMCASAPIMESLRAQLQALGQPAGSIHFEAFSAPANTDRQHYTIALPALGREIAFAGQPSLLAALTEHAIEIPHDCRNGSCGACQVRLEHGEVRQVIAPENPPPGGRVLACCVVPASALQLRL